MTHLRKMMLEELERRNYAQTTRDCYIQTIGGLRALLQASSDQAGTERIPASTRRICSASGNSPHIPSRNGWPGCASSSSGR